MNQYEYRDYREDYRRTAPGANGSNGMATASLILGICSLLVTCCCCIPISFVCGLLAVVFAFVSRKGEPMTGKAKWGLALGILGLVVFLLFCFAAFAINTMIGFDSPEEAEQWLADYESYIASPEDYPEDYMEDLLDRLLR